MLWTVTRPVLLAAFFAFTAHAAILPDQIGGAIRGAPKTVHIPDADLLNEYGLEATEQAAYSGAAAFNATAWRFHDSTGAMAFFESQRPPAATRSKLTNLAANTADGVIFANGNYVFQFTGSVPPADQIEQLLNQVPKFERSSLPTLMSDLPLQGLIPNSERYILGPVSLARFFPQVSPAAAAFHLGTEAQIGQYTTPAGPMTMAIFNFPTPSIARERDAEFQKISGALAKRAGPLVAIIIQPPDADAAERVLAQVRYEVNLTLNDTVNPPTIKDSAKMILAIAALAGIVLVACLLAGIGVGAFRVLGQKLGWKASNADAMIVLDLHRK